MKPQGFDYMMVIPKCDLSELHKWLYATFGPQDLTSLGSNFGPQDARWTGDFSVVGKNSVIYFKREQDLVMAQLRWS